jgi:hypothetical protein
MKAVVAGLTLAAVSVAQAGTVTSVVYEAVTSSSQIGLPNGMNSVIKAVNVGSSSASTVNSVTFAADDLSGNPLAGNGYATNITSTESGAGISGASFTSSTVNVASSLYMDGDVITGLKNWTEYLFEIYFSDNHPDRYTDVKYIIGSTSGITNVNQGGSNVHRLRVAFNTGGDSTFDFYVGAGPDTTAHHAKISGFALYEGASVPEPSALAVTGIGAMGLLLRRRNGGR